MTDTARTETGVAVTINGREVVAEPGELVIDAAERHGVFIPRFCYHPRMNSVGMCRMCIVEVDTGRGATLQPSCMIPVADGMVVDTESAKTAKAQDGVLEFLLINHPLDCPVCDKGGECPLQDQAYAYGPGESRFVEEKRHFEKPIPISDVVLLDRERCILCDRCTRFADEVAGDTLIHFQDRGNETQVNTFPDHPFASYFSGNTVQICPVGALTATPYRFKARPWDLEKAESTCTSCSVGCRVVVETSRNRVLRYQGVDLDPVNWGWLCDKGRFDFESVDHEDRLSGPLVRSGAALESAGWADAIGRAADAVQAALDGGGPSRIGVLGGARLTNEDAYAWTKLVKGVWGTDHVDAQMGDGLPPEVALGLPPATIDEVCAKGGTILYVGPDPKEELPVLYLRLRHAVVEDGATLVEVSPTRGGLSDLASVSIQPRPGEVAATLRAVLSGAVDGDGTGTPGGVDRDVLAEAAHTLAGAVGLSVVLGRMSVAEGPGPTVAAAHAIVESHADARFLVALRRANVRGAMEMGLAPGMLPGRVTHDDGHEWFRDAWGVAPEAPGRDARGILEAGAAGDLDVVILLGADPLADFPDTDLARRGLDGAGTVIATDLFLTESSRQADVVLAAAGYAECEGTTTNLEGRVSTLSQKVTPPGTARSDWIIAADLAHRMGHDLGLESVAQIQAEIAALCPTTHAGLPHLASAESDDGVLLPLPGTPSPEIAASDHPEGGQTPQEAEQEEVEPPPTVTFRAPDEVEEPAARDAYSLRLVGTRKLYDEGTLVQHSPSIAGLAEANGLRLHPHDFDRVGVEAGTDVKVISARGSATVPVVPDGAVPRGAAVLHVNRHGVRLGELIDPGEVVTEIRVETAS